MLIVSSDSDTPSATAMMSNVYSVVLASASMYCTKLPVPLHEVSVGTQVMKSVPPPVAVPLSGLK